MTRERRENVLLLAFVCSAALHVGLMFLIRSSVMTRPTLLAEKTRPAPMRVSRTSPRPDPVKIEEILDLKALKDAPAAVREKAAPRASSVAAEKPSARLPAPDLETKVRAPEAAKAVFEAKAVSAPAAPVVPRTKVETPKMTAKAPSAPDFAVRVPSAPMPSASAPTGVEFLELGVRTLDVRQKTEGDDGTFEPAKEVYEKVDEAVVAAERAAVRELVNASSARDLAPFVDVRLQAAEKGGWRYFRVTVTPKAELPVVPKDVVVLIDGSGSIGNDRFGSCRRAARQILRTATNTGDRFNVVVFRNAYSYAFRAWQECTAESFAAADKWLRREAAHGRTDVFATIRSVLTLPRDPERPLIALVVTDGDANMGVSDTAAILAKFTALNDGLVSVYMYGVKSSANRELIDVLTHGNRGESFVFDGWRWNAGEGLEGLSERFRDPVLSDLRVIFASGVEAEAYPRLLRNLYRGQSVELVGRVKSGISALAFSLRGISSADAYEAFYRLPFASAAPDVSLPAAFAAEAEICRKLGVK